MAKTKAELLEEAKKLKLDVSSKNTIAEITAAIQSAGVDAEAEPERAATTAKAGKRSAKGVEEAEAKAEKVEHQHHREETENKPAEVGPKKAAKPARSRLERRGKKFREAAKLIEKDKHYELKEALELAVKTSPVKFDATVELHARLAVDPRQADQNIRDNLVLPSGTGKTVRIAVFADDAAPGADLSGVEDLTKALDKGTIDFDILISPPANMAKLGKYARLLGPRGLMPSPKSGTVTADLAKAVSEAKAGRVEYRVDSTGIVHLGIGKVSFGADKLLDNAQAVLASLKNNKPGSVKGVFVRSVHITSTMGPSVPVDPAGLA